MACVPASRTPEGVPGNCPICDGRFDVEPSYPTGDPTCPRCGSLVWVGDRREPPRPLVALLVGILDALEALRSRLEAAREGRQRRVFRRLLDGLSRFVASTEREKAHSGAIETPGVWDRWIDGP
jgi:hypothetical protein